MKRDKRKIRITAIVFLFPPLAAVGYKRPLRYINYWAKKDFDVIVFSVTPRSLNKLNYIQIDNNTLKELHPKIIIKRFPSIHFVESFQKKLRHYMKLFTFFKKNKGDDKNIINVDITNKNGKKLNFPKSLISKIISIFETPDPFWGWILLSFPFILMMNLYKRSDFIYSTGYPWTPLLLSVLIGKMLRIPVIVDYRDPWHLNPYKQTINKFSFKLELFVLKNANLIITNTESMNQLYKKKFPSYRNKMYPIFNTVDSSLIDFYNKHRRKIRIPESGIIIISHTGTIYNERLTTEIIEQLAFILNLNERIELHFYGNIINKNLILNSFKKVGLLNQIKFKGIVNTTEARLVQLQSDFLLLLQPGTEIQIPAKIFEYVLAKKPIISFSSKNSEINKIIQYYKLGINISSNEDLKNVRDFINLNQISKFRPKTESFLRDFNSEKINNKFTSLIFNKIIK